MTPSPLPTYVAIGASGGEGLQDIQNLLAELGPCPSAIVMVVLHRASDKPSMLRDVLACKCAMPVTVASGATAFRRGTCYIGQPDAHLTLMPGNKAHLVAGGGHRLRNRTIDTLFASLAQYAGAQVVGIILSGALDDGSRGLAAIHAAGGLTMVLDPHGKPRGMQQNAIDYDGPISFIGSATEIAIIIGQILAAPESSA